jgi:putative RNA 2'-phosphotransferase
VDARARLRASKFLSKHLRHDPAAIGLTLDPAGWVPVPRLLAACAAHGLPLTRDELAEIVATSDKRRFALDEAADRLRANQGHSVPVDLGLPAAEPPAVLYHGTASARLAAIRAEGLRPMKRHHVHLSPDAETARRVGARHGAPVVLRVDARAMHAAGHVFRRSENGVWLVDTVPPAFLAEGPGEGHA